MAGGTPWTAAEDDAVAALVAEVCADRLGQVSPSVYETARLVSSAPWLAGHAERLQFLLATQHPDGSWGAPDGYGVVPTLSATEALLTALRRGEPDVADAAERGVSVLTRWLGAGARPSIPDTIAAELIVPWLVAEINAHLGEDRIGLPEGIDGRMLAKLQHLVRSGQPIPEKAWHSLEAFGPDARQAASVQPAHGLVCGSPAAIAAWLGEHSESAGFLEQVQAREGGPVRGVAPIDLFEGAWVTSILADADLPLPHGLAARLSGGFIDGGAPAGRGLPADADDTAAVLYALAKLGRPGPIELLWDYEGDDYFCCFPNELTASISTNAHVLDALGEYAPPGDARFRDAIDKVTRYLHASQEPDGSWWDKWHASPYYATTCCALALTRAAGPAARPMVARAIDWLLETQRADGSWGRWTGTAEETAYAVQSLLLCSDPDDDIATDAALRAAGFLRSADDDHPPLWHDKDLYTPVAVVRAARLAALRLIATRAQSPTAALG